MTNTMLNTSGDNADTTGRSVDPEALEAFGGLVGMQLTAAANAALVALGDKLGLWKALAASGPVTAADLAEATAMSQRLLAEWLATQAANGFLSYEPAMRAFTLSPEAAAVLADEDSPALMIGAFQGVALVGRMLPKLEDTFRTGEGIAWHDHDLEWFAMEERFSRPFHRQFLVDTWLAAVPGLHDHLRAGAYVADVGCGFGLTTILMAQAFPASTFVGFDFHDHSIAQARKAARDAGVADRVTFEVADARDFPGSNYDVITFFDSLHDMGEPVAAARHALVALAPDGILVTADPAAADTLEANMESPMAGMFYAVSTFLCTPTAMAQNGTHALGAMAGEAAIRRVLLEAGAAHVERVAPDAPMNMVLTATRSDARER